MCFITHKNCTEGFTRLEAGQFTSGHLHTGKRDNSVVHPTNMDALAVLIQPAREAQKIPTCWKWWPTEDDRSNPTDVKAGTRHTCCFFLRWHCLWDTQKMLTLGVGLTLPANNLQRCPHRQAQNCMFHLVLKPIKWAVHTIHPPSST